MKQIFENLSLEFSKRTTRSYSTSFSFGITILDNNFHQPIYNIYGFVRFADEIVDTFHNHNKKKLLDKFKNDCHEAINDKISLNPILHSFQKTVNKYQIDIELINTFLKSMYMDIDQDISYNQTKYEQYILGSAEVVGLMCLKVFTYQNTSLYKELTPFAKKLGSAFQKVNFLRDMKADYFDLGRVYFPNVKIEKFDTKTKNMIEHDIQDDFNIAYKGIKKLPKASRGGVYLAYIYYLTLFLKIKKRDCQSLLNNRIRINNGLKLLLMIKAIIKNKLNTI